MSMRRDDPRQYHLHVAEGDVGRYVFLPGDPGRSELIARHLDTPHHVATNREFETWTGFLEGEKVSVTSTGIGGPSAAIAMEELVAVGADTFIRVGTAGSMQPHILPGHVGVISAAIRDEGTTKHYLPVEFPAVADHAITDALWRAAQSSALVAHLGVSQSKDSFYGQHEPERMPVSSSLLDRWDAWVRGGAICSEMESAALFVVAHTLRVRAGAVVMVMGNPDQSPMTPEQWSAVDVENIIPLAVEAMRAIIIRDREAS
jgi:uridine phosphorylase